MAKARSLEVSEIQASGMERKLPSEEINQISQKQQTTLVSRRLSSRQPTQLNSKTCRQCGLTWPHNRNSYPAKGQLCRRCNKPNHFAKMCLTKPQMHQQRYRPQQNEQPSSVNQVASEPGKPDSSSDDEYLYVMSQDKSAPKIPTVSVTINEIPIDMIIDTGASIDILDETAYKKINHDSQITLQPSTKRLFAYGSQSQLHVLGSFDATITVKHRQTTSTLQVLEGSHGSLLSYLTAVNLGILNIQLYHVKNTPMHEQLFKQYPALFEGIGQLKGAEVKLHIDTELPTVAQKARQIPFHLHKKVELKLKTMEERKIIEKVDGPTPWLSPLVLIPKKNGEVRICVDMLQANKAITHERYPTPTIDDLIHTLNGARIFSKLDLRSGYHQLTLAPESRYITTFATHQGLWRYCRLNFGTNSASEIFQRQINEQVCDIPGVLNISDDHHHFW